MWLEEPARHGMCFSQVVGGEPGGSVGGGLCLDGTLELLDCLSKDGVVLQAIACVMPVLAGKIPVLRSGDLPQMVIVTVFQNLCYVLI